MAETRIAGRSPTHLEGDTILSSRIHCAVDTTYSRKSFLDTSCNSRPIFQAGSFRPEAWLGRLPEHLLETTNQDVDTDETVVMLRRTWYNLIASKDLSCRCRPVLVLSAEWKIDGRVMGKVKPV